MQNSKSSDANDLPAASAVHPVREATASRRGANILLEVLESEGVEYIFGNPGTTELPLLDALIEWQTVSYVLGLQEAAVVAMADGYAQAARRPAFLNLHTAGGLGHGMGNLLNAHVSQTPLVVTAGQQDSRHMLSDPLLYADLEPIAKPAVKWTREVRTADEIPVLVRRAFHDAQAAPSGPVFLSLPMNVMEELSPVSIGKPSFIELRSVANSLPQLASLLAAVTPGRLALVAGDEVYSSGASAAVVQLAEVLGAEVYGSSWPSRMPYPTSHPLWRGNLPTTARDIAHVLQNYDAVFALGGKSLITILYTHESAVPESCDIFQMSADVTDLGRTFPTKLSLVGDLRESLAQLLPLLVDLTARDKAMRVAAVETARRRRQEESSRLQELVREQQRATSITPLVAAHEAVRAIGPDIAIVDEAIATAAHVRSFLHSDSPGQYSFLRGGALGWGMPAAVGCSLGLGRAPVVSLVGDGAALYSPQALWTAAHEKLPVTFVVMNNCEYNVLKNFMRRQQDYVAARTGRFLAMDIVEPAVDYSALAASMGVPARRIDCAQDIAQAIEAGIRSNQANLIEVVISTE